MRSIVLRLLGVLTVIALVGGMLTACSEQRPPLKIGFAGGLTGRVSGLGVDGRNGALLAIENANRGGGINGQLSPPSTSRQRETAMRASRGALLALVRHEESRISYLLGKSSMWRAAFSDRSGVVAVELKSAFENVTWRTP